MNRLVSLRVGLALVALGGFAFLILTARPSSPSPSDERLVSSVRVLLIPLTYAAVALVRGWYWGRWVGLAGALGVLPWATVILLSPGQLGFNINALLAVTMSAILLSALLGPQMFEMYEGRSRVLNWSGARMILVRWSIILNLSSAFSLYLFSTAYEPAVTWHIIIPGTFLVVLVGGTWLLGLQKTSGLLLVASGCLGLIPAGTFFVLREAASPAEAVLFGLLLAPGVVLGCSLVVVFGRSVLDKLVPR